MGEVVRDHFFIWGEKLPSILGNLPLKCFYWNLFFFNFYFLIMPFKKKSYKIISDIKMPRPPQGATHIILKCDDGRGAMIAIKDIDTLMGTVGNINYAHMNLKTKKIVKQFDKSYRWNGSEIEELIGVEE